MASGALIECMTCAFRHVTGAPTLWEAPIRGPTTGEELMLTRLIEDHDELECLHRPRPRPARWALAGLALSMLMPSLDTSIANVGLPTLAQAFDASFQQVQWIVVAYLLAVTTLIVGAGRLGDIFGRRRMLLGGIA